MAAFEGKAALSAATWVAFTNKTEARDKLTKIMQYGSRALAFHLLRADPQSELGERVHNLYKGTQVARKGFRIGKGVNEYAKAMAALADPSLAPWRKALTLVRHAAMSWFWAFDHAQYFARVKFAKTWDAKELSRRGGLGWFTGCLLALVLAGVAYLEERREEARLLLRLRGSLPDAEREAASARVAKLRAGRGRRLRDVAKALCDTLVSSNTPTVSARTGNKFNDGTVGALGCVSASLVLYNSWPSS